MDDLKENWSGLVQSLELVAHSEISDLQRLQQLSTRRYLAGTGNKVFAELQTLTAATGVNTLRDLGKVTVEQVSRDGDRAVLRMKAPTDLGAREHEFVLVDGHWLPASLADGWAEGVRSTKRDLAAISSEQIAKAKPELLQRLKGLEQVVDQMLAAEEPEALQVHVLLFGTQFNEFVKAWPKSGPPPGSVLILIDRELTEQEETLLLDQLQRASKNPERTNYNASRLDGQTRISLTNIADVKAFADQLEELGSVKLKYVDVTGRTIKLQLKSE